jgi:ribonucleotide reductase class II
MQVQTQYTEHNTSATIEFEESEIEELAGLIHQAMGQGYVSAALLARFHSGETFPRLPFEPVSLEAYDAEVAQVQARRKVKTFAEALERYDSPEVELTPDAACTSTACLTAADRAEMIENP